MDMADDYENKKRIKNSELRERSACISDLHRDTKCEGRGQAASEECERDMNHD